MGKLNVRARAVSYAWRNRSAVSERPCVSMDPSYEVKTHAVRTLTRSDELVHGEHKRCTRKRLNSWRAC